MGFTATYLVKESGIKGSNAAHEVKLFAMELNPTIPGLEIKSKPKSTKNVTQTLHLFSLRFCTFSVITLVL